MKQVLIVEHMDFRLEANAASFVDAFQKAHRKQTDIYSATNYKLSDGIAKILDPLTDKYITITDNKLHPVFFENKDYVFSVEFEDKKIITQAYVYSRLMEVRNKFFFNERVGYLSGTLNFGNDLGRSELIIRYLKHNKAFEFVLDFEVFPTKLDYRYDYNKIVSVIEKEFPQLILDFLKKTYSGFKTGSTVNTDLIWWQVFGGLFNEFIGASAYILNKPHSRLIHETIYVKADKIKRLTPKIEEEFHRFRNRPEKNYRTQNKLLSVDTPENRFFKYALNKVHHRFQKIRGYIQSKYETSITPEYKAELEAIDNHFKKHIANPFFNTIGKYGGMRQESLVLEWAMGYSTIYKDWIMLNAGISFFEGVQKMELKNIADLYQVWCFLEIKKILEEILEKEKPDNIKISKAEPDDFVFKIDRGLKSMVEYLQANGKKIELYHDLKFSNIGARNIRTYTVAQRPDIVLHITKGDLKEDYVLTYLYDAKYRLESDINPEAPDFPPDDAINQMHRYRDAIYYQNKSSNKPEKEIIGGYVLFPGSGDIEEIKKQNYLSSIKDVNIGAFPLCPNDYVNRILLKEHLLSLINSASGDILQEIIPQKDMIYETVNPDVLIGLVKQGPQTDYFLGPNPLIYHTGADTPSRIGYDKIKYFAPYISGKGFREYYEVLSVNSLPRNNIYPKGHLLHEAKDTTRRLILNLGKKRIIKDGKYNKLNIVVYRYSKLDSVKNANVKEQDNDE